MCLYVNRSAQVYREVATAVAEFSEAGLDITEDLIYVDVSIGAWGVRGGSCW